MPPRLILFFSTFLPMLSRTFAVMLVLPVLTVPAKQSKSLAQDAAPAVRLLKSGRLPPERIQQVLELVCQRGSADDLAYVFSQVAKADGFPTEARLHALEDLAAAANTRQVLPEYDTTALGNLCGDSDQRIQTAALRLAGAWHAEKVAGVLQELVTSDAATPAVQRAAIDALAKIGPAAVRGVAARLVESSDVSRRLLGIAALAPLDPDRAAKIAAEMLRDKAGGDRTGELLAPILEIQGGADKLAAAVRSASIPADAAKLALQYLYATGRSDAALVDVFSSAAGLNIAPPTLDAAKLKEMSAEVLASGDPGRGEKVFRRDDLSCLKCHAVSGAGGDIGPDLSPVGSTSPPDYLITSILNPDLSIKENFITRAFVTDEGRIYQGIVTDRDEQRVVLKQATGERVTIPVAHIVDEAEGKSLMPKGLAGFLSHQEFLDLVRFLSALGKPGEYEIRTQPTVQRWRVLAEVPPELTVGNPDATEIRNKVLSAPDTAWQPAYAQVAGVLPLDDVAASIARSVPLPVLYLRADLDLTSPGDVEIQLDSRQGIRAWIDDQPLELAEPTLATLGVGQHRLLLRVDRIERGADALRVVVDKAHGSTAAVTVVGGR